VLIRQTKILFIFIKMLISKGDTKTSPFDII